MPSVIRLMKTYLSYGRSPQNAACASTIFCTSAADRGPSQTPPSPTLTRKWGLPFTVNSYTAGLPATMGESTSVSKSAAR